MTSTGGRDYNREFREWGGGEGVGGLRADHQQEDKCFCRSRRDSGMIYLALKLIRPGA